MEMLKLFNKEYGLVKYVCVNGEYRFCSEYANHKDQVVDGEKANSAGFVYFDTNGGIKFFKILSEYSMTLCVGPNKEIDGPAIATITGLQWKQPQYDY